MFENLISNLKFHSLKVSESLTNFKANTNNGLVGLKTKFRDRLSQCENNVEHNPIPQSPDAPININNSSDMKWLESMPREMNWVPQVPSEENEDIVDRFTNISDSRNYYKRTDREEIRRRLAMGTDNEDYYGGERTLRKPSLQTRLQSGMNLQICFMNDAMSDNESPNSDSEAGNSASSNVQEDKNNTKKPEKLPVNRPAVVAIPPNHVRPSTSLMSLPLKKEIQLPLTALTASDFISCQARLQAEARVALSQAKEMARMQMEVERQKLKTSPITQMVRKSLEKVGIPFPQDRRRLSRQVLTEMNIAQLQVIVNDLHTQIEKLNESLVKFLIGRDDLHMEQDSMLVDIEDLTRYLGAKEKPEEDTSAGAIQRNNKTTRTPNQNGADMKPKE